MSDARVIIEYFQREDAKGFWIDVVVDRSPHGSVGPFASESARQWAQDDMLNMVRSLGGQNMPARPQ